MQLKSAPAYETNNAALDSFKTLGAPPKDHAPSLKTPLNRCLSRTEMTSPRNPWISESVRVYSSVSGDSPAWGTAGWLTGSCCSYPSIHCPWACRWSRRWQLHCLVHSLNSQPKESAHRRTFIHKANYHTACISGCLSYMWHVNTTISYMDKCVWWRV